MAEDLSDLADGCAMTDHPGCQAVTKEVSSTTACTVNAGSGERLSDDGIDRGWAYETDPRRPRPQEDPSRRTGTAVAAKVAGQRRSHIGEQWEAVEYPALAAHDDLPGAPADIPEIQGDHLSCAQTQSYEQEQDGVVSTPTRGRSIGGRDDTIHVVG
jgi:hypothetical protein